MDASRKSSDGTAINIPELSVSTKAATEAAQHSGGGGRKGGAIFDFILRLCAIAPALAASATMGTTNETLPFFTTFFQFQAQYNDIPTFSFFVIINAIVAGYLLLSLPFSVACIVRPDALGLRLLLLILDTVMMALTAAAASAAAAIVYLAHSGNPNTNWAPICQQYNDSCKSVSGAVVGSFIAAVLLVSLVQLSAVALRKHLDQKGDFLWYMFCMFACILGFIFREN